MNTPWQTLTIATLLLQVLLALGALPSGGPSNVVKIDYPGLMTFRQFSTHPTPLPLKPGKCGLPKEELDQLVREFNAHRLEVAEKNQIANMHEIRYDFELEKAWEKGSCFENVMCKWIVDRSLKFGEPIVHTYSTITGFAFCSYPHDGIKPIRLYLYFPTPPNNTNHVVSGPPGSQCPNGKAASGLCKAPWNTETTTLAKEIDNGAKLTFFGGFTCSEVLINNDFLTFHASVYLKPISLLPSQVVQDLSVCLSVQQWTVND